MAYRRNSYSRRKQFNDSILSPLPMQLEVLLLAVLPAAFFFAIWKGAYSIAEKSTVLSQALGVQVDLGVYYDQFRPILYFSASVFSITIYFKARKWIQRKISACLA